MTQVNELIKTGYKILKQNSVSTYQLDTELILSNVLNKSREQILTGLNKDLSEEIVESFFKLLLRRARKEPIAYIFREKEFWSKKFFVNNDTLIPRPETELMIEKTSKYFYGKKPFILDVGTGSGCILLSLLKENQNSRGVGIDISNKAIKVAKDNANKLGLSSRSKFYKRSIDETLVNKFDLIVSNPPYLTNSQIKNLPQDIKAYEPEIALKGGNDGLDVIKKVIYKSKSILKKKGMLALEIGNRQYIKVLKFLKSNNFRKVLLVKDYQDNVRCIISVLEN